MPARQVGLYQRQETLSHAVFVVMPIGCKMCVHESDRGIAGGGAANQSAVDEFYQYCRVMGVPRRGKCLSVPTSSGCGTPIVAFEVERFPDPSASEREYKIDI
jgi:hypothetical protein